MQTATTAADAYFRTEVQSRSPLEMVVMLYDGAARFLGQAREALDRGDAVAKRESLSRALAVIAELQNTLNLDAGGDIASSLDALYTYMIERVLDANLRDDPAAIDEALTLLSPLRDSWSQIADAAPPDSLRESA